MAILFKTLKKLPIALFKTPKKLMAVLFKIPKKLPTALFKTLKRLMAVLFKIPKKLMVRNHVSSNLILKRYSQENYASCLYLL